MKTKRVNLALLAGTVLMMGAQAARANAVDDQIDNPHLQNGRAYVGGTVGYGSIDAGPTAGSAKWGFAWNVNAGYLWHKDAFAYGPELSYDNFPSVSYSGNKLSANTVNAMAVGQFAFNEKWSAVGKAGLAVISQTYNGSDSTRVNPAMYIGGTYMLDEHWNANGGYQYVSGSTPMYAFLVGATYTF
jgi:hypothetical protein